MRKRLTTTIAKRKAIRRSSTACESRGYYVNRDFGNLRAIGVMSRHHVARCAFADKMAPGKWRKFYNGAWNEPGLGGKASHDVNAYVVTDNEHLASGSL